MKTQTFAQARALLALALPLVPLAALAASPAAPDAGSILQQIRPITPPAPSSSGTGLTVEQGRPAKAPPSVAFAIKRLEITGNRLFDTATLHALVADGEGKSLTLAQLDALAGRITNYYHARGYALARAIIPAQTIRNGVVQIEVIEAHYGKIRLENHSPVSEPLLSNALAPLRSGQIVSQPAMDRALLLLSDIPGVVVNATLKPGDVVGTSDLDVTADPGAGHRGSVSLDDYGDRYTGRARVSGTYDLFNPWHHGDVLSLSSLSSGADLLYGRLAYDTLLNGRGTRAGASYSRMRYTLGGTLSALNAYGTAQVSSAWVKQVLLRSRTLNLYGQLQYDNMRLRDHIDTSNVHTDRHLNNWTANLSGDLRDGLFRGGITTWNLGWTTGRVGFDALTAQTSDAATANTQGQFSKCNLSLARLQALGPKNALYVSLSGQWTRDNLDSSQKMALGGPYSVRAYDSGAASGDQAYQGSIELRHDLGSAWQGKFQGVVFADGGHVTINRNPWTSGANSANLRGAGIGLDWFGANHWRAKAYIAHRLGTASPLVASTASTRAWVEVGRSF